MPAFHLRYAVTPNTNVRFAVTRTDRAPELLRRAADTLAGRQRADRDLGNTDLRPTKSWNVDGMAERYFKSWVCLGGIFLQEPDRLHLHVTLQQQINGAQYQVTQPLNGDRRPYRPRGRAAKPVRFLPWPLDGLGSTPTTRSATRPRISPTFGRQHPAGSHDTSAISPHRTRKVGSPGALG